MNENPYVKLFTVFGFLSFAAVSCWATAESLHLLLPDLPALFCWIVTIGFFFIASLGTKMMADSLNQHIYMENRGTRLLGGLFIVLIFWLVCSMPTNTHTFFYRNLIHERVTSDALTTQGYLAQIKDNTLTEGKIQQRIAQTRNQVDIKLGELKAEIENEANPGFGPKSNDILREFAELLGVAKVEPLSYKGVTKEERQVLYDAYRKKIYILLDSKIANIKQEMSPANANFKQIADANWKALEAITKDIEKKNISLSSSDDVKRVCEALNEGYTTIKTYQEFVAFNSEGDKAAYTAPNPETKVKRLLSVYDVWVDFVKGETGGLSFVFWIIISVLVDFAAFIFFDIAFKKK